MVFIKKLKKNTTQKIALVIALFFAVHMPLAQAEVLVNDPGFTLDAKNTDKQWGLIKAGFPDAWLKTLGSYDVKLAVIDTGIDETHVDLQSIKFLPGYDFVTDTKLPVGSNSDDNGHGTLVTGVIAATPDNRTGIAGTNWQISIMPLKVLDKNGSGDGENLAKAIRYAVDQKMNIVNISLGGTSSIPDADLAGAVQYAFDNDVLLVAAAGNDSHPIGISVDTDPVYPVCQDGESNMVLGVVATDADDKKATFSNYGRNCVDVAAPGKKILSTIGTDPYSAKPEQNGYAFASGTSLAVPFVAGEAALLKAAFPEATMMQIRNRILSSADPIDALNTKECQGSDCKGQLGSGRINVVRALSSNLINPIFNEGELVKVNNGDVEYLIQGGKKNQVYSFVKNQRLLNSQIRLVLEDDLQRLPTGPYVLPKEGTLVKSDANSTVFMISQNTKLPITYNVFLGRGYSFSNVVSLPEEVISTWITGKFLPPPEGTLLKTSSSQTVYWVVGNQIHPINYGFYKNRGLYVFSIQTVSKEDLNSMAIGEAYIL